MAHPIVQQDLHSTQMFILLNAEDNTKITIENSKFNSWHGEVPRTNTYEVLSKDIIPCQSDIILCEQRINLSLVSL
jgi:hypothetical protein